MRYISTSQAQLPELDKWYADEVGHSLLEDEPEMTRDEAGAFILGYVEAVAINDDWPGLPVVTLKNVKIAQFASEETPCYEATAYVDGVKLCTVSNQGHGGCDSQDAIRPRGGFKSGEEAGTANRALDKALALIEWRFRLNASPREAHGMTFFDDFETACMGALGDWETSQQLKRGLRGKVCFKCPQVDGVRTIKATKADGQRVRDHIATKYPGAVIINDEPEADALAWYFDDVADPRELVA